MTPAKLFATVPFAAGGARVWRGAMGALAGSLAAMMRRVAWRLDRVEGETRRGERLARAHLEGVQRVSGAHDMAADPDEAYYGRQYLHWILGAVEPRFPRRDPVILDLGCGQGRLAVPLAEWARAGRVIAVDFTPSAVEAAWAHARRRGVENIEVHEADVLAFARGVADGSVDVVVMTEVAFFMPAYRNAIAELPRILRCGGMACVSFWSQYQRLLQAVKGQRWESADMVMQRSEGHVFGEPVSFSWQTVDGATALLREAGLSGLRAVAIGLASGIPGEPFAELARPSQLEPDGRERLMTLETALAPEYAGCGRYILVIGTRDLETPDLESSSNEVRSCRPVPPDDDGIA